MSIADGNFKSSENALIIGNENVIEFSNQKLASFNPGGALLLLRLFDGILRLRIGYRY